MTRGAVPGGRYGPRGTETASAFVARAAAKTAAVIHRWIALMARPFCRSRGEAARARRERWIRAPSFAYFSGTAQGRRALLRRRCEPRPAARPARGSLLVARARARDLGIG